MDAINELTVVLAIVLLPTVPVCWYLSTALLRRRGARTEEADVTSGRAPETPFVVLATVGMVIAFTALVGVALALVARAVA